MIVCRSSFGCVFLSFLLSLHFDEDWDDRVRRGRFYDHYHSLCLLSYLNINAPHQPYFTFVFSISSFFLFFSISILEIEFSQGTYSHTTNIHIYANTYKQAHTQTHTCTQAYTNIQNSTFHFMNSFFLFQTILWMKMLHKITRTQKVPIHWVISITCLRYT